MRMRRPPGKNTATNKTALTTGFTTRCRMSPILNQTRFKGRRPTAPRGSRWQAQRPAGRDLHTIGVLRHQSATITATTVKTIPVDEMEGGLTASPEL